MINGCSHICRDVRWIRKWLSRHRKGKSGGDGSTTERKKRLTPKSAPMSSTVSAADHSGFASAQTGLGGISSIHRLLQVYQDPVHREKRKRKLDTVAPSSESAAELPNSALAVPYVQIAKPGTSFSLPLHPLSKSSASRSSSSLQVNSGLRTHSLTQSPSLGYIPLAFPMHLNQPAGADLSGHSNSDHAQVQPTHAGSSSTSANPDLRYSLGGEASQPKMYHQSFMPTVPTLLLKCTQPNSTEGPSNSAMLYLSQLLLDASNAHVPPPAAGANGDSEYLSRLSPLSFAPSLQSHSTSVLRTVNNLRGQNLWYPPPPVAFRTRVTDLALLTKRIRTTYEQSDDFRSVQGLSSGRRLWQGPR